MGDGTVSRMVNVLPTIWGPEFRVVLTPAERRDWEFIQRYGPGDATAMLIVADMLGKMIHALAWDVAAHVQILPFKPGDQLPGSLGSL